jgi:sulfur-oxidizing protein SoxX
MGRPLPLLKSATALFAIMGTLSFTPQIAIADETAMVEAGKEIAFDRKKGNCLACHHISGGDLAGNIGPPLVAMKSRFPDRAKLRVQIFDATAANKNSMMPPFGRHNVLSDSEIDKVVAYIYSL